MSVLTALMVNREYYDIWHDSYMPPKPAKRPHDDRLPKRDDDGDGHAAVVVFVPWPLKLNPVWHLSIPVGLPLDLVKDI